MLNMFVPFLSRLKIKTQPLHEAKMLSTLSQQIQTRKNELETKLNLLLLESVQKLDDEYQPNYPDELILHFQHELENTPLRSKKAIEKYEIEKLLKKSGEEEFFNFETVKLP